MPRRKEKIKDEFIKWLSIPKEFRKEKTGWGTQTEFAEDPDHDISRTTLSRWKSDSSLWDRVENQRVKRLDAAVTEVYERIKKKALTEDGRSGVKWVKLLLRQARRKPSDKKEITKTEKKKTVSQASDEKLKKWVAGAVAKSDSVSNKGVTEKDVEEALSEAGF